MATMRSELAHLVFAMLASLYSNSLATASKSHHYSGQRWYLDVICGASTHSEIALQVLDEADDQLGIARAEWVVTARILGRHLRG